MDKETALRALDVELLDNNVDALTVRAYLRELLVTLLIEEEGFSGKRPFGNSGWQHDIIYPLHAAGFCSEQPGPEERTELFNSLVAAF